MYNTNQKFGKLLNQCEKKMYVKQYKSKNIICGCDEAGRGALAGPVIAGAVVLPKNFSHKRLNDSKKLSEKSRNEMADFIKNNIILFGNLVGIGQDQENIGTQVILIQF